MARQQRHGARNSRKSARIVRRREFCLRSPTKGFHSSCSRACDAAIGDDLPAARRAAVHQHAVVVFGVPHASSPNTPGPAPARHPASRSPGSTRARRQSAPHRNSALEFRDIRSICESTDCGYRNLSKPHGHHRWRRRRNHHLPEAPPPPKLPAATPTESATEPAAPPKPPRPTAGAPSRRVTPCLHRPRAGRRARWRRCARKADDAATTPAMTECPPRAPHHHTMKPASPPVATAPSVRPTWRAAHRAADHHAENSAGSRPQPSAGRQSCATCWYGGARFAVHDLHDLLHPCTDAAGDVALPEQRLDGVIDDRRAMHRGAPLPGP